MKPLPSAPSLILTILLCALVNLNLKGKESTLPVEREENSRFIAFSELLKNLDSKNPDSTFPYKEYVLSQRYYQLNQLVDDHGVLSDSIKDPFLASKVLYVALTEQKEALEFVNDSTLDYRRLIQILHWANACRIHASIDTANEFFLTTISDHWMNFVTSSLKKAYVKDWSIKFDSEFQHIDQFCQELGYNPGIGADSYLEKVIDNANEFKFVRIASRGWNSMNWSVRLLLILGIVITLYAYFVLIKSKLNCR